MMKAVKKWGVMLMIFAMFLSIAACSKKPKKITAEEFRTKLEAASYDVSGDENAPTNSDNLNSILVGTDKDMNVAIIYYSYLNKADAKKEFDSRKSDLQAAKEAGIVTNLNISDYKIVSEQNTSYAVVIRADEVLIMAGGSDSTAVNDALKILGL